MIDRPRAIPPSACWAGLTLALGLLFTSSGSRANEEFLRIDHPSFNDLEEEPFRLQRPLTVHVHCEGAGEPRGEMFAYGWILNLRTRKVEWALTRKSSDSEEGDQFVVFDGDVRLPAGEFAAYYAPFTKGRYQVWKFLGHEWARIRIDPERHPPRNFKRWGLSLATANDADQDAVETLDSPVEVHDPQRFVEIVRTGDEAFVVRGFTLPEKMQIRVYCQGEFGDPNVGADVGWILNAETRAPVWELGPDNYKDGGGSFKNKISQETITLPAGNYLAYYVTDDSHSHDGWNDTPPYDPDGWGMILSALSESDAKRIRPYTDPPEDPRRAIVDLVRQGDGAFVNQGFTLKADSRVRVHALGEYGHDEFVDRGWLESFASGRTVWSMTENNTRHAGGAEKNRMADEVITLQRGDYVVYYSTDDSHAYGTWNSTPPYDPEAWGIRITGVGSDFGPGSFKLFDPEQREQQGKDYLVRMVRVGNDEHRRQRFKLDKPTRVHIFAEGEGLIDGQMADYGWIEDVRNGTWVWEMTIRNTRHAGGDVKNRLFDGTLLLDAGEYDAHFVTDDSHAWNAWNRDKPDNPNSWGLTITHADSK
jgi:hypothetical protein